MNLTDIEQLFADEEAVSPVIGVILMVAITVILAAVIGTFVLGLGDNVQNEAPQANFQFSYQNTQDNTDNNDLVSITHNGGQDVQQSTVSVQIGSDEVYANGALTNNLDDNSNAWDTTISTGDTQDIQEDGTSNDVFESGENVRIIWQSPSGGSSNTIGSSQVP